MVKRVLERLISDGKLVEVSKARVALPRPAPKAAKPKASKPAVAKPKPKGKPAARAGAKQVKPVKAPAKKVRARVFASSPPRLDAC